uniref:Amine oxidase domain-containing protein n=1 Tax=Leersia perrieri TaxID=77586 RepID=A0A0D9XIZ8_9ORYZ
MKPKPSVEIVQYTAPARVGGPKVIIIGAGMSGISAGQRLSDAGISDFMILEATDRIGGRIHKTEFAGMNVEMGANWVEGVNIDPADDKINKVNPIWTMVHDELKLNTSLSNYDHLASNTYMEEGGLYDEGFVQKTINRADEVQKYGDRLSSNEKYGDITVMAMQRFHDHLPYGPTKPVDMVIDYYTNDYEFAEPPRVTSLQSTHPLPTFADFGDNVCFVADQQGFESVVHHVARQYLETDASTGDIVDPRLLLNKVVKKIKYTTDGVVVKTEDGWLYEADYVMVSVSIGVLQSNLIRFKPHLPHLENEYPGSNILLVTVTDDESRRIEQQTDEETKAEAMEVLRKMFPNEDVPEATDILVPRWWSDRFFRGSFSNWPIGVDRYEYDLIRAPVGRVYFPGEHTSERYNGYVHGAYLAGKDSADILIECVKKGENQNECVDAGTLKYDVPGKYE